MTSRPAGLRVAVPRAGDADVLETAGDWTGVAAQVVTTIPGEADQVRFGTALRPHSLARPSASAASRFRLTCAVFVVAAFSMAPLAIYRAVDAPLGLRGWPLAYSVWLGGLFGAALFSLDVIGPMRANRHQQRTFAVAMAAPGALALWALASALWTDSPRRTPSEAVVVTLVILLAAWFGWALTYQQQTLALFVAFQALTLISIVLSVTQPSARFWDGSWMGAFTNPNLLGPVATFGLVASLGFWSSCSRSHLSLTVIGICIALDVVVAVMATSVTSWLALVGAATTLVAVRFFQFLGRRKVRQGRIRMLTITTSLILGLAVLSLSPFVLRLLNRERSWSYRRETWDFIIDSVRDRPIVGFGFGSFWDDLDNIALLYGRIGTISAFAHSTFFESLLMLGAVGFALVVVVSAYSIGAVWSQSIRCQSWSMTWWSCVATFTLIVNLSESMIAYHSIFWMLLVAPGFVAARWSVTGDRIQRAPPQEWSR